MKRRSFIRNAAIMASIVFSPKLLSSMQSGLIRKSLKPLSSGDKIALIAPGTAVSSPEDIAKAKEVLDYFGFRMQIGKNVLSGSGYKRRSIRERVDDIHSAFSDPGVKAVFALRGGYGCGQLLDKIDYNIISSNPKIFLGYSDITALHLAFNQKAGLVTFHGPVMLSPFTALTEEYFTKMLIETDFPLTIKNPEKSDGVRNSHPTMTIVPGKAKGKLTGGNLSLISSLMGTEFEIDTDGKILFLEDVGEAPYSVDRMLNQLRLAGKFKNCKAIVFGTCEDCSGGSSVWDGKISDILKFYFADLDVPVFSGLLAGHSSNQLTLPLGWDVEIDAESAEIIVPESPFN